MDPFQKRLSDAIRWELMDFRFAKFTPLEINSGLCKLFAETLVQKIVPGGVPCCMMHTDYFTNGYEFRYDLLSRYWPWVVVPEAYRSGTLNVPHWWVVANGRHYDAETPEGVDNFFDLPFFQRGILAMQPGAGPEPPKLSRKLGEHFQSVDLKPFLKLRSSLIGDSDG